MALLAPPPSLVVADVQTSVLRGEGRFAGRRCARILLGGCNLTCSWCDTGRTWDGSSYDLNAELRQRLVRTVLEDALSAEPSLVVIGGGEPLLQQRHEGWPVLLEALGAAGVEVEVETNGTLLPNVETLRKVTRFSVSPKLAHAGDPAWSRLQPEALQRWAELARVDVADFLFVVRDATDLATVVSLSQIYGIPRARLSVMPEGATGEAMMSVVHALVPDIEALGLNLSLRLDRLLDAGPPSRTLIAQRGGSLNLAGR